MKIVITLIAIAMFAKDCKPRETSNPTETNTVVKPTTMEKDTMTITYQALSRGFFEKIWITEDSLNFSTDRDLNEKSSYPISASDWNNLLSIVENIDISSLPKLEAPTDKRMYDGAAIATLTIEKDGKPVESSAFDHGHPPESIESLVKAVLALKNKVVKD